MSWKVILCREYHLHHAVLSPWPQRVGTPQRGIRSHLICLRYHFQSCPLFIHSLSWIDLRTPYSHQPPFQALRKTQLPRPQEGMSSLNSYNYKRAGVGTSTDFEPRQGASPGIAPVPRPRAPACPDCLQRGPLTAPCEVCKEAKVPGSTQNGHFPAGSVSRKLAQKLTFQHLR